MLLAAIRQAEDNGELLEKTVLKLRLDQKGDKSSNKLVVLTARRNVYSI